MSANIEELYAELAAALGVDGLPQAASGSLQLQLDDGTVVMLFGGPDDSLVLVAPVLPLPADIGYGAMLWLMRRNHHDSPIAPFRLACDQAGTLVIWGRLPVQGVGGKALAGLVEAVGQEARAVRGELGYGDIAPPAATAAGAA